MRNRANRDPWTSVPQQPKGLHDQLPDARTLLSPGSQPAQAIVEDWITAASTSDAQTLHDEGLILARLHGPGFVDRTPSLDEMVKDEDRTALFEYDGKSSYAKVPDRGAWLWSMREVDGLRDINDFFGKVLDIALNEDGTVRKERSRALQRVAPKIVSMQENLTFVGEQEFMTGAVGIAVFWKSFLDANPDRQIFIASNPSTETGRSRILPKSDRFVTDRVLGLLRAHDDGTLADRVVRTTQRLTAAPEDTLVAVGDDWLVTGTQMQGRFETLLNNPAMRDYRDSMEIHVLAAPESVIRDGFKLKHERDAEPVKVRAYFAAHDAPEAGNVGNSHTTGHHSAVGFGFATDVEKATDAIKSTIGQKLPMPPLASIYRPYWPNGSLHRSKH